MQNYMFKLSRVVMAALEKVIKANIIVEGLGNIPDAPCLFVVNHFTRLETFLVPYVLFKKKEMQVNSLASTALFKGMFGKYLSAMGTVPMQAPGRNRMIIHDLLTGDANWVIYPEGMMVKNKSVFEKGKYRLNSPLHKGPPHTGAAVLALKAEIARQECLRAAEQGDRAATVRYAERYRIDPESDVSKSGIAIVPVNITYYPLRPGQNFLSDIAGLFFKDLPARLEEELKTEGKILLSDSDINIFFGEPIEIMPEVKRAVALGSRLIPFISKKRRDELVVGLKRKKITQEAMKSIYTRTAIHVDHLFCMALRKADKARIHRKDFARALYLSALEAGVIEHRRTHPTLERDLIKCIVDEDYSPLESICKLTETVGALKREGEFYCLNRAGIAGEEVPFHDIRIKNAAVVIANELEPLKEVVAAVKRNVNMPVSALKDCVAKTLHERNLSEFNNDYDEYFDEKLSNEKSVGNPIFMHRKGNESGVVLAHGYLAAPQEMRPLAEFLFERGYSVYVPCLKGMGTAPAQLKDIECEDWIYSFDKAYAVVRNSCRHVYAGGFSAGGLLALIAAARKQDAIKAVFSINAPLLLQDFKSHLVPGLVTWNDFIEKLKLDDLKKLEYIENDSESPDINYSRNYTKGVLELARLMSICDGSLNEIRAPLLVLQGKGDPVVKPQSADVICEKVNSKIKQKDMMPFDHHIIVRKEGREKVFMQVHEFLEGC